VVECDKMPTETLDYQTPDRRKFAAITWKATLLYVGVAFLLGEIVGLACELCVSEKALSIIFDDFLFHLPIDILFFGICGAVFAIAFHRAAKRSYPHKLKLFRVISYGALLGFIPTIQLLRTALPMDWQVERFLGLSVMLTALVSPFLFARCMFVRS
jgi:hypothetical protein